MADPWDDYEDAFGDFATNGMQKKGHVEWTLEGVPGVKVPGSKITHFEQNDIDETDIITSGGDANLSRGEMIDLQDAFHTAIAVAAGRSDEQAEQAGFEASARRLLGSDDAPRKAKSGPAAPASSPDASRQAPPKEESPGGTGTSPGDSGAPAASEQAANGRKRKGAAASTACA